MLTGDLASSTAADIQATGRTRLAELAVETADQWRQQQAVLALLGEATAPQAGGQQPAPRG